MSYYGGDLSSCSSRDDSSSDESENDAYTGRNGSSTSILGGEREDSHWARSVLYLDIDCFYCQCEEIDRDLRAQKPLRPLAIGQKHIIVTCNYEARKYGVKKLQLREHAMAACPELWIVEGSDLESYRRHSRAVYESFRSCLQDISSELRKDPSLLGTSAAPLIPAQKGSLQEISSELRKDPSLLGTSVAPLIPAQKGSGMDEMMADLTLAIHQMLGDEALASKVAGKASDRLHIYGEAGTSSVAVLVEDQTGAEAVVSYEKDRRSQGLPESRRNVHQSYGTIRDRQACGTRLRLASQLAARIRERIREQTGFTTTVGISVSPLLAKMAIIEKPDATNILYPWRSADLLYSMPLRKLQGVGSRTARALDESMEQHVSGTRPEFWKVRDLLRLPNNTIVACLEGMKSYTSSSSQKQCEILLGRCRGRDETMIEDDQGGPPKTVSVENSFRRGSTRTLDAVWAALDELFVRLPRLLKDRKSWSPLPQSAYPRTIRLSLRMVDASLRNRKRRPFQTTSKQAPFDGNSLMREQDLHKQSDLLKRSVFPLVHQLVEAHHGEEIDVTRINIAVTNFQDIPAPPAGITKAGTFAHVFSSETLSKQKPCPTAGASQMSVHRGRMEAKGSIFRSELSRKKELEKSKEMYFAPKAANKSDGGSVYKQKSRYFGDRALPSEQASQIDRSVLAELPSDIAEEIREEYLPKSKKRRIDQFFSRKSS